MHVQIPEIVIGNNWGKLGILGCQSQSYALNLSDAPHTAQLILQFPSDFNLGFYIGNPDEEYNLFDRYLGCENSKFFHPLEKDGMNHLIFEMKVKGEIKNPQGYLKNLLRRLKKIFYIVGEMEHTYNTMIDATRKHDFPQ